MSCFLLFVTLKKLFGLPRLSGKCGYGREWLKYPSPALDSPTSTPRRDNIIQGRGKWF